MEMNVILIDLRQFNPKQLKSVCADHNLDYDRLSQNKTDNFSKIWIDTTSNKIIAFTYKDSPDVLGTKSLEILLDTCPLTSPQRKQRVYDMDSILEKISKYGIGSLKQDEKDFLENLNK